VYRKPEKGHQGLHGDQQKVYNLTGELYFSPFDAIKENLSRHGGDFFYFCGLTFWDIEKAILVGVITPEISEVSARDYLDELAFLAETAGAEPARSFLQRVEHANPRTFVNKGKIEEIAAFIAANEITLAIFDDELTPSQMRNIEQVLNCRVIDRTNLILDIFASRARTSHARTQVELAQYQYLLPRLTGMWTHLERQRGGIGLRGPGETEIETDRRIIRDKISKLKEQLKKIDTQMNTQRKGRSKMVRVALVGYTNVGKSTLMNQISKHAKAGQPPSPHRGSI
jgi:GTP-binding protein HflX